MTLLSRSRGDKLGKPIDPSSSLAVATARTTFAVSKVPPASQPLPVAAYQEAIEAFLGSSVEACSIAEAQLVARVRSHPLVGAVHAAFTAHRPLCLTPDIVWLTLTQGLAHHINANAERLRNQWVAHQGQVKISVRRDDFIKGSPTNPWPEVFTAFSAAIKEHIGESHALIVADFSTTGPVERAASEIVLLDAMQAFFSYEVVTRCGIPSITLEGTVADWQTIRQRVREFERLGLDWWTKHLDPILKQFVDAAGGHVNQTFWDSIYKWNGPDGSGSPFVSGWITNLFPYLNNPQLRYAHWDKQLKPIPPVCRNEWLGQSSGEDGPGRDWFPCLPAKAPFVWKYLSTQYQMEFIGGLVGIRQDPQTLCLRPEIGWAVREATDSSVGRNEMSSHQEDFDADDTSI